MYVSASATGTQTTVLTTEHTLTSPAVAGRFQLIVDTSVMVAGDVLELRAKQIVLTGGTLRVVNFAAFYDAQPTDDVIKVLEIVGNELVEAGAVSFTMKQTFGTVHAYPWKVLNLSTTPANISALSIDSSGRLDIIKIAGTTQTARDIGASVLLSSGAGAGQLDFTSGVVKANLAQILGTALTETAGQIAAGFKQFFNIASPTSTMNTITTVTTATTTTNLTNAPTSGDLTATMKTSVTTAATAATPIAASVTGAVGSVSGNVGGNVAGSVASVTAGVTVTTNNDKTGYGLSAAAVQAVWDALTSALTTSGSIGKRIADNLDVVLSTRLATSGYTAPLDAAGTRAAVGLASANLDTQLGAIAGDIPTATQNADALLNRDMSAVTVTNSRSPINALRFLRNKWSISSTTLTVTKEDDSTSAWTSTLTTSASADPVTGSDPA